MDTTGSGLLTVRVATARPSMLAALTSILREPSWSIELLGDRLVEPRDLAGLVAREAPAVLLLDAALLERLDDRDVQAAFARARQTRVLLIGDDTGHGHVADVLRHHFHGFLATTGGSDTFRKAIGAVMRGELWLSRTALATAIAQLLPLDGAAEAAGPIGPAAEITSALTPREMQIVELVRRGRSNKEIAHELGVVEDTVKKHLQSVFGKLGVHRRALVALRPQHRNSSVT
jgi:DNA-binding NarL/FixJ family response regulator